MPTIDQQNALTAAEITDKPDIRFGVSNLQGATPASNQMSLPELGKAIGSVINKDTVAEMLALTGVPDGTRVDTARYSTSHTVGDGSGGEYVYDADSTATIDGGFVLPGIGGSLSWDNGGASALQARTATTVTLPAASSATDDFYNGRKLRIWHPAATRTAVSGTGATIVLDNGSSVDDAYIGRRIRIEVPEVTGTVQAGTATTITLAAGASATDDFYNGRRIQIGGYQSWFTITDYDGTTKIATIETRGHILPASTGDTYVIRSEWSINDITDYVGSTKTLTISTQWSNSLGVDYTGASIVFERKYDTLTITDYNGTTKVATASSVPNFDPSEVNWVWSSGVFTGDVGVGRWLAKKVETVDQFGALSGSSGFDNSPVIERHYDSQGNYADINLGGGKTYYIQSTLVLDADFGGTISGNQRYWQFRGNGARIRTVAGVNQGMFFRGNVLRQGNCIAQDFMLLGTADLVEGVIFDKGLTVTARNITVRDADVGLQVVELMEADFSSWNINARKCGMICDQDPVSGGLNANIFTNIDIHNGDTESIGILVRQVANSLIVENNVFDRCTIQAMQGSGFVFASKGTLLRQIARNAHIENVATGSEFTFQGVKSYPADIDVQLSDPNAIDNRFARTGVELQSTFVKNINIETGCRSTMTDGGFLDSGNIYGDGVFIISGSFSADNTKTFAADTRMSFSSIFGNRSVQLNTIGTVYQYATQYPQATQEDPTRNRAFPFLENRVGCTQHVRYDADMGPVIEIQFGPSVGTTGTNRCTFAGHINSKGVGDYDLLSIWMRSDRTCKMKYSVGPNEMNGTIELTAYQWKRVWIIVNRYQVASPGLVYIYPVDATGPKVSFSRAWTYNGDPKNWPEIINRNIWRDGDGTDVFSPSRHIRFYDDPVRYYPLTGDSTVYLLGQFPGRYTIHFRQDSTGGHNVTFANLANSPPTISSTANAVTIVDFESDGNNVIKDVVVTAADDTFTAIGHGFDNDDRVFVQADGGTLPGGVTQSTVWYYVVNATTDTFELSTTSGGAAVNITSDSSGLVQVVKPALWYAK